MPNRSPSFQWYPDKWEAHTGHLTDKEAAKQEQYREAGRIAGIASGKARRAKTDASERSLNGRSKSLNDLEVYARSVAQAGEAYAKTMGQALETLDRAWARAFYDAVRAEGSRDR